MSRSAAVLPYRVLGPDALVPDPLGWRVVVNGRADKHLADGAAFSDWDGNLTFSLEREFRLGANVAERLGLDADCSCCELIVSAATGNGLARKVLWRDRLPAEGPSKIAVSIAPDSTALAKELTLTTGIYLADRVSSRDNLAPSKVGSRLWETTEHIRLEGGATRLPLYAVPFADAFVGKKIERAEFHIEVGDDPALEVEMSLTVYVNTECSDFVADLGRGNNPTELRLWGGIIRRVVAATLLADGEGDLVFSGGDGLSAVAERWMSQIWPDHSTSELRGLMHADFSLFESQIDSWLAGLGSDKNGGNP